MEEGKTVIYCCSKCGKEVTMTQTFWETIQKMDFSIMEGMLINEKLCRECHQLKDWSNTFLDFEEERGNMKLIVCPTCKQPMKVFTDKNAIWTEFWVCEKCQIALDASR